MEYCITQVPPLSSLLDGLKSVGKYGKGEDVVVEVSPEPNIRGNRFSIELEAVQVRDKVSGVYVFAGRAFGQYVLGQINYQTNSGTLEFHTRGMPIGPYEWITPPIHLPAHIG